MLRGLFLVVSLLSGCLCESYFQPEQIHLSYGEETNQITVTWVTLSSTNESIVEYGVDDLLRVAKGTQDVFIDGGNEQRRIYMHRVHLPKLYDVGTWYAYHVGSRLGWSAVYTFKVVPEGPKWSPRFAVFGDMGNINARSMGRLQQEVQRGHFDAILHVGDFAYNLDTDNARYGDEFMRQIETIAGYVPYMTVVGNHEAAYNFSNYMSRFTMPKAMGDGHNMFYSVNIGPIHLVGFSSEYYYFTRYGWEQIKNQYEWLENDLRKANLPENRAKRPWIISMCHRPLYCSNSNDPQHCPNKENIIRVGLPYTHQYGIEDLLYKYGVDLHFQAHEHSYERMYPVYNLTVCKGSGDGYVNPRAPVHIVTGSAGCQELVDPFVKIPHPWSAAHSDDYGYTRMQVFNSSHLYMEQLSDKQDLVIDKVWIVKDRHGQGVYDCHKQADYPGKMTSLPSAKHRARVAKTHADNVLRFKSLFSGKNGNNQV